MRLTITVLALCLPALDAAAWQAAAPAAAAQAKPDVRVAAEEVVLDVIFRDKRGRALKDVRPEEVEILDNGVKRQVKSMRLVQGREATENAKQVQLDAFHQIRLITLMFDGLGPDARRLAKQAAMDLIKEPAPNAFFAVLILGQQLNVVQDYTQDASKLKAAIEKVTSGANLLQFASESGAIREQLQRQVGNRQPGQPLEAQAADASQRPNVAPTGSGGGTQGPANAGADMVDAKLAEVLLRITEVDTAVVSSEHTRMVTYALGAIAKGQSLLPGRKTVLYFTQGLSVPPQLQPAYDAAIGAANRANVSFYPVDARGLVTQGQNAGAFGELSGASRSAMTNATRTEGPVSMSEVTAQERGENSMRSNVQQALQHLAESTGGFLISDTNDFRGPVRRVNEETQTYYEITYDPGIEKYDGTFRRISVRAARPDTRVQARSGYFAIPAGIGTQSVMPFEVPLLTALTATPLPRALAFRSAAVRLDPARTDEGRAAIVVEIPMKDVKIVVDEATKSYRARLTLVALVKDLKGTIVKKLSAQIPVQGPMDRLDAVKDANFIYKEPVTLPSGRYTVEAALMDVEANAIGARKSVFVLPVQAQGVALSNITLIRRYEPGAPAGDASDPFRFQGGRITPTLNPSIKGGAGANMAMFFTVYPDKKSAEKPHVVVEYIQDGKVLGRGDVDLPEPDADGRIPYVMSSSAAAMAPGMYEIRVVATQGKAGVEERTLVTIE